MLTAVIFLTVLSQTVDACVPNTSVITTERLCVCNEEGQWSEPQCDVDSQNMCKPGEYIQRGCSRCLCGDNSQLVCSDDACPDESKIKEKDLSTIGSHCVPSLTYFVDCNICTCPQSGNTIDAKCSPDPSCASRISTSPEVILSRNMCIPKVMYLFPCLHCLCTEFGTFSATNCYETCINKESHCLPKSFYKRDCNVCYCPASGIKDNKICSRKDCSQQSHAQSLRQDRLQHVRCSPHSFTEPKCLYCDCSSEGRVNEHACLELECLDTTELEYDFDVDRGTCRPGEMVLLCSECLCLESGTTSPAYCSRACNYESKLRVLNLAVKDSIHDDYLIDKNRLKRASGNTCRPETVFLHEGRYCICPNNSRIRQSLCSLINVDEHSFLNQIENNVGKPDRIKIPFGAPCKDSTFVEFDCNSCFCSAGFIDAKWCTFDDCNVKSKLSRPKKHQHFGFGIMAPARPVIKLPLTEEDGPCTPGCISKIDCNFCICPDSGLLKERACTKNNCTTQHETMNQDFSCEPMHYYEVDCNVCLCPRDGQKNVDKCTQNVCQKTYLRTMGCVPGQLFSDECNVCVCPLNGDKDDKACTDHSCPDSEANLLIFNQSQVQSLEERKLDFCFSGEQFVEDCKFCVCPDTGLKAHAICNTMMCDDEQRSKGLGSKSHQLPFLGRSVLLNQEDQCNEFLIDEIIEKKHCEAGAIYTTGCKQCICPSAEAEEKFCRTIPTTFCANPSPQVFTPHIHENYPCPTPGKLMDECFVCDCEDHGPQQLVVREHCFKSESAACRAAKPDFLLNLDE